jgi:hypothetical protein
MVDLIANAVCIVCDEVSHELRPKEGEKVVDEERIVFVLSTLHKDPLHPEKGFAKVALNVW